MESPESIIDAIHANVPGVSAPGLPANEALRHQNRDDVLEESWKLGVGSNVVCELFAEKIGGHDNVIGFSQPKLNQIPQTAAHRIPNDQRARKHSDRRRHTEHDCGIRPPVVGQASNYERARFHVRRYSLAALAASECSHGREPVASEPDELPNTRGAKDVLLSLKTTLFETIAPGFAR